MTAIHCRVCPFAGCIWCDYQGGITRPKDVAAEQHRDVSRYDGSGKDERPPAPTDDLSSHSESTSPKGGLAR